jgi:hypothetical protein
VLAVYPLFLGAGKRLFAENADPREFALISSTATPTGLILNSYRCVETQRSESAVAGK